MLSLVHPVRIVVLDTGYDSRYVTFTKCPDTQPMDFTRTSMLDTNGHGTNIIGIISDGLISYPYCIIPIKVFVNGSDQDMLSDGLLYALSVHPDIINISGGGEGFYRRETTLVEKALDRGIRLVVAAGNDGADLDKSCVYFPACDDSRIDVVGAVDHQGNRMWFSNYGSRVKHWMIGQQVYGGGHIFSGTSQATALYTSKLAKEIVRLRATR